MPELVFGSSSRSRFMFKPKPNLVIFVYRPLLHINLSKRYVLYKPFGTLHKWFEHFPKIHTTNGTF